MKKLYLISYFFAPLGRADGINRTYLTKFLAEMGWDIDVISCKNPHGFIQNFQKDPSLLEVLPASVKLHQIESFNWGPVGGIATLLHLLKDPFANWQQPVLKNAETIFTQPGLIYAIIPPIRNALIAYEIAQRTQYPLVLDFRDNVKNLSPKIVTHAKTIIASTPQSLQEMREYYHLPQDIGITMYNGYPVDHSIEIQTKAKHTNQLKIIYAGLINLDQDPAMLPRAINYMEKKYPETKGKVEVDFYGPQNYYTRFFLKKYLNQQIQFKGYLPFKEILTKIAEADLAYTSLQLKNNGYCVPSKIFQYMAMETPILGVGPAGDLQRLINEENIGRFSLANDIEGQAEDIYELLTQPQIRTELIENIRRIKPDFHMRAQTKQLSEHLKSLF